MPAPTFNVSSVPQDLPYRRQASPSRSVTPTSYSARRAQLRACSQSLENAIPRARQRPLSPNKADVSQCRRSVSPANRRICKDDEHIPKSTNIRKPLSDAVLTWEDLARTIGMRQSPSRTLFPSPPRSPDSVVCEIELEGQLQQLQKLLAQEKIAHESRETQLLRREKDLFTMQRKLASDRKELAQELCLLEEERLALKRKQRELEMKEIDVRTVDRSVQCEEESTLVVIRAQLDLVRQERDQLQKELVASNERERQTVLKLEKECNLRCKEMESLKIKTDEGTKECHRIHKERDTLQQDVLKRKQRESELLKEINNLHQQIQSLQEELGQSSTELLLQPSIDSDMSAILDEKSYEARCLRQELEEARKTIDELRDVSRKLEIAKYDQNVLELKLERQRAEHNSQMETLHINFEKSIDNVSNVACQTDLQLQQAQMQQFNSILKEKESEMLSLRRLIADHNHITDKMEEMEITFDKLINEKTEVEQKWVQAEKDREVAQISLSKLIHENETLSKEIKIMKKNYEEEKDSKLELLKELSLQQQCLESSLKKEYELQSKVNRNLTKDISIQCEDTSTNESLNTSFNELWSKSKSFNAGNVSSDLQEWFWSRFQKLSEEYERTRSRMRKEADKLEEEKEDLQHQIRKLNRELEETKIRLISTHTKVETSNTTKDNSEVLALRSAIEKCQLEKAQLEKDHQWKIDQLRKSMNEENAAFKARLRKELDEIRSERDLLAQNSHSTTIDSMGDSDKLLELEEECNNLREDLRACRLREQALLETMERENKLSHLENPTCEKCKELESVRKDLDRVTKELQNTQQKERLTLTKLERLRVEYNTQSELLKQQLETCNMKLKAESELKDTCDKENSARILELEAERDHLMKELNSAIEREKRAQSKLEREHVDHNRLIQELKSRCEIDAKLLSAKSLEIGKLEAQINSQQNNFTHADLLALERCKSEQANELKDLKARFDMARQDWDKCLKSAEDEIRNVKQTAYQERQRAELLHRLVKQAEEELETLHKERRAWITRLEQLQNDPNTMDVVSRLLKILSSFPDTRPNTNRYNCDLSPTSTTKMRSLEVIDTLAKSRDNIGQVRSSRNDDIRRHRNSTPILRPLASSEADKAARTAQHMLRSRSAH